MQNYLIAFPEFIDDDSFFSSLFAKEAAV